MLPSPSLVLAGHITPSRVSYARRRATGRYRIERGTLATSGGLAFTAAEFEQHITEEQVPHSTALHARLAGTGRDGDAGT